MAAANTSSPTVDHMFVGDSKLLNATFERRTELRKVLSALQQDLQRIDGAACQVTAEIRLNIAGHPAKEHIYSVSITDAAFDSLAFARSKIPATSVAAGASSPPNPNHPDRRPSTAHTSQTDDVVEVRPFKKARTDPDHHSSATPRTRDSADLSDDTATAQRINELSSFVKSWHSEWTRQGGWLFDTLNANTKASADRDDTVTKKLDGVQDILGQSLNSASATTMAELSNITKLIPWLEHCRKTNADKVQAREEKWRSSSATFHDQSRRDRETAEKRLEDKLEAQRQLLIKVAEANGIDVDELSARGSREGSLGAQLTKELNEEVARVGENGLRSNEPISIDD